MCPETHPFVFNNGEHCCKTNEDFNGNPLQSNSQGCKNNGYGVCPTFHDDGPCLDYKGRSMPI